MDGLVTKAGNIVFMLDDVLVETSKAEYDYFSMNAATYGKYMDLLSMKTIKDVHQRQLLHISTWLLSSGIYKKLTQTQIYFILSVIYQNEKVNFLSQDFYASLEPTQLARKTLMNPVFLNSSGIKHVYICAKYNSTIKDDQAHKAAFISKWFGESDKLNTIFVSENENPADQIQKACPKWDLVVSDDIKIVQDLAKNDIDHREFLLPSYGYNKASNELLTLIRLKSANLNYYDAD